MCVACVSCMCVLHCVAVNLLPLHLVWHRNVWVACVCCSVLQCVACVRCMCVLHLCCSEFLPAPTESPLASLHRAQLAGESRLHTACHYASRRERVVAPNVCVCVVVCCSVSQRQLQCRYASQRERVGAPNVCVCCSVLQCVAVDCRGCCSVVTQVGEKELALLICVCAAVCCSVL